MSRAESLAALERLVDDWYALMRTDRTLQAVLGFDSSMERRDWDAAKASIERRYGRSAPDYRQTLDTLAAAIRCKTILAFGA